MITPRHAPTPWRPLCVALALLLAATAAHAQVRVGITLKRPIYIVHEPLLAEISIANLSGNDLELTDAGPNRWFSFRIERPDGTLLAPREHGYQLEPITIGAGQSLTRVVNLTPLYPLDEFGQYRVRAAVFVKESGNYFTSAATTFEITDGRQVWQQTVGVPAGSAGGGNTRTITLLTHRLPKTTQLYLRITDAEDGRVFCTHQLGRIMTFGKPQVILDKDNSIHVLQVVGPKTHLYSHIGLAGEVLERSMYSDTTSQATLVKGPDGTIKVAGGEFFDPNAPKPEDQLPNISDRPVPMPTPAPAPTPKEKKKKEGAAETKPPVT